MKYEKIVHGTFESRPNRFIADVWVEGVLETVHVKNTGRCKELLLPGVEVVLCASSNPARKTKYDLVAVYKENFAGSGTRALINMDSQAPNKVAYEWLLSQGYDIVKPEYTYGKSRIDFYMEKGDERYLMEVKGCTLEVNGTGYFPDAPTERGAKHLRELAGAASAGFDTTICYVIQMPGIREVLPNATTDPKYATAMAEAEAAGVKVLFLLCDVSPGELKVVEAVWKK